MAAVRQFATGSAAAGVNVTAVMPQNVLAGTALFVISISIAGESIDSISDTRGNTYTNRVEFSIGAFVMEIWAATTGAGAGANTISPLYNAITGGRRIWALEVGGMGNFTLGASDSHDQPVAQDPMTLANLTGITNSGLVLLSVGTDTTMSLSSIDDADSGTLSWITMAGGSTSFAGYKNCGAPISNITPLANFSTTETGESIIAAFYDEVPSGGGGAHFSAFIG